jgi:hypothetical protein
MNSVKESNQAKQFNPPSSGNAGLYVYRDSFVGQALKKDIWIDGKCIGESAPDVFFYEEVSGNQEHKLSTESEFSPNDLILTTETGKNYFIEQHMELGLFVGGASLELVNNKKGMKDVFNLKLAKKSICSK